MSINVKVGLGFLIAIAIACASCLLFFPDFAFRVPTRRLFSMLPGGSVYVLGFMFSASGIILILVNNRRRKKGKPPI